MTSDTDALIHPSAIIDEGAELGAGVRVWHFAHVCAGAVIGPHTSLGQGVYVAPTARIGRGCRVQNHVSLYDGVILEDHVFVGPSAVFTNVTTPRAHVSRQREYETTRVGRGASIGANATILCGLELGEFSLIGAGCVVTRDVLAFAIVTGTPSRQLGWACHCGARLEEPAPRVDCHRCGAQYLLDDGELYWIDEDHFASWFEGDRPRPMP